MAGRPSGRRRAALAIAATVGLVCLLSLAEAGVRVAWRLGHGAWPVSQAGRRYDHLVALRRLCRRHPFLGTAPRAGASVELGGKRASFNSAGYRSPERSTAKPPGVRRVVCEGGSTTFDSLAPSDESTWPWRLEERLRASGGPAEVWNAGFPGWTSLEDLISLAIRDVDLGPDLVVLYQGINDLQPASLEPFDPEYERGHAGLSLEALGLGVAPPPFWARSLLLERLAGRLRPPGEALQAAPVGPRQAPSAVPEAAGRSRIPEAALAVFARNVRSLVGVARAHGAQVLLVTQPIRLRAASRSADERYLEEWVPGEPGAETAAAIDRFNDELRRLGGVGCARLADAAAEIDWQDADFGDPVHYTRPGAEKLSAYLAPRVAAILAAEGAAGAPGGQVSPCAWR